MARGPKTVRASRSEARKHLGKAEEFLEHAQLALGGSRHDAAMLNAIHAAISTADAVSIALGERRSADPDHQRAVDLLEEIAGRSETVRARARQLRLLLAKKHVVEYESRRATAKEAREAAERAARLVAWATETLRHANL